MQLDILSYLSTPHLRIEYPYIHIIVLPTNFIQDNHVRRAKEKRKSNQQLILAWVLATLNLSLTG